VYRWLNHFDLHPYFHTITTGDDVRQNKPAPDIYYLAAEQLQVSPQKCLVFEDSVFGIQAAKSAGMTVVAVPNTITRNLDFNQADKIINGLNQISIETLHTISPAPSLPGISL
jgi:beta-phosphoglucomutase-like phosphatase (HAD superfamily)